MSGQRILASEAATPGLASARGADAALHARLGGITPRALMVLAVSAAAALLALMVAGTRPAPRLDTPAAPMAAPLTSGADTIAVLERRIQALEAVLAERGGAQAVARAEEAAAIARNAADAATQAAAEASLVAARPQDRLVPALLNLQMVTATARPWHRELRAVLDLDATRQIPAPVVEVLTSHSLRGVPTEGELHDRFLALAPAIAWRMPADQGMIDRAQLNMRAALSQVGLAAPPPPGEADAATASIADRLRRGDLAGAVADATALDKRAEPLLVGWMAQARARLAVEQALRETILALLARSPPN
jgi:hypothetical protein